MSYLEKIIIKGFKKFTDYDVQFNNDMNVLIGENEAGKSTIIEAIDLVLNQKFMSLIDSNNEQLFNLTNINKFKSNPIKENLPEIDIELFLNLDSELPIVKQHFLGVHYLGGERIQINKSGIKFQYKFDKEFDKEFDDLDFSENQTIPLELYKFEWLTFQGGSYKKQKNPLKALIIDNSSQRTDLYGSYAKQIFESKIDTNVRRTISYSLKQHMDAFVEKQSENLALGNQSIGIDSKKTSISRVIDIKENNISLQNMGKGKENIVKTEVALQVNSNLVLVEEPENHLSHSNTRKLIEMIKQGVDNSQMIISTHNPLVISRLNLRKTIWISDKNAISLEKIDKKVAKFFEKSDNLTLLEFILSNKVILVEGATEYIYIPEFYRKIFSNSIDESGIHVISMSGIKYKNYVEIAKHTSKKMLVITDNDGNQERIDNIKTSNKKFEEDNQEILIKCDTRIDKFTFEVSFYKENEANLINFKKDSKVTLEYKEKALDSKALAYMLKNKTESAIEICNDAVLSDKIVVPQYIKEGLEWLEK
ncbi:ATP-dependent nuclease [Enterococcus sp.]|uniref:ATP-dependent nuclease n=1 Tax=Enterococcus sp. TaxID=35783 RepID=UPI002FC6D432